MENHRGITRRQVLRRATAGLAAGAAPWMITSAVRGSATRPAPNDRIAMGFIGVGGMGFGHLRGFFGEDGVEVVAVADPYGPHRERAVKHTEGQCTAYRDYRELLAREDIDGVVIATPDHWHARTAIDACEAGKDVYCEKPLSLTIREARAMVEATRRHGRVFQVGSQQRSGREFRLACEVVQSGRIGKLQWMKAGIGGGPTCDWEPNEPPPADLNWDLWLGPAPWADYTPKRCIYTFRWFYDYSGGKMTDWGAHHNDIAQWVNGASYTGPVKVEPIAVKFPSGGLFDTAESFEVKSTYANGVVLYTVSEGGGVELNGTDGWVKVDRGSIEASDPDILKEPLGTCDVRIEHKGSHRQNWLQCMKTRERPICDVEIGCRSATVCHLGNIALRTGKTIEWNPDHEEITNDAALNRWLHRPYRSPWTL